MLAYTYENNRCWFAVQHLDQLNLKEIRSRGWGSLESFHFGPRWVHKIILFGHIWCNLWVTCQRSGYGKNTWELPVQITTFGYTFKKRLILLWWQRNAILYGTDVLSWHRILQLWWSAHHTKLLMSTSIHSFIVWDSTPQSYPYFLSQFCWFIFTAIISLQFSIVPLCSHST